MRALQTAATGMAAQELNVQVISNNIANLRTTGYKRQQAHFQDLLYETFRRAGSTTSDQNTQAPAGVEIGSGVKTASTARVMTQGNLTTTEKEYDVAIRGDGFFKIRLPDGRTAYTRDGSFDLDSQGQLVTRDGYLVDPGITVPQNAEAVSISANGSVEARCPGRHSRRRSASFSSHASSTNRALNPSATTFSSRRPRPDLPSTAIRDRKVSATFSKAISKRRTSTPSPRSRRSSPRSAPTR